MFRRGPGLVVCATACASLAGMLASVLPSVSAGAEPASAALSSTSRTPAGAHRATIDAAAVPAFLSADGLRAQLPAGGTVGYHLPALPAGGVRVLGDWNGDGAQTPGVFAAGQWQLWSQVQRPTRPPTATVTFGQAGDVPVTGDWNGDGSTDIGVVRGNRWLLALGPFTDGSTPTQWRDVTFGDGSATPVVGDWDGDGTDGIGTFENGAWVLADSVDAPDTTVTASFGTTGDRPVVGDWGSTGHDGLGVVRGSTWYLTDDLTGPRHVVQRTFAPVTGDTPTAWQVADVPGATTCPTARPGRARRSPRVEPSTLLGAHVTGHLGHVDGRVRASLEESERYLLGDQYAALWRPTHTRAYLDLLDQGRGDELSIRLPAMSALTVAVGLTTDAYDRVAVGSSRARGFRYVDQLVRSIACAHVSVSPGGWGRGWETAHWAMLTGAAAWLTWTHLTAQTRADVVSMVTSEADRLSTEVVPYWARPDGTIVTPGDTKAEEDSWNSSLLAFAAAMMPSASHASVWRAKAAELAVAAYATRGNNTSRRVVNGVSLDRRLDGYNAYSNGTVVNHQIIHPDYASAIQLLWTAADFDRLARQRVPEAMFHNGGLVYSAFSTVKYTAGAASPAGGVYSQPGGTVYELGHSGIYYPQGDDWGSARRAHFVSLDAHARVYARYLHGHGWPAGRALAWHETGQMNLVASSGATDGRTYSVDPTIADQQDTYPGREEYAAQNLATAWLALYIGKIGVPALDTSTLRVPKATTRAARPPATARRTP
ncbi:MAG TPA: hypothetical protein VH085_02700 [Nocardioides sp.]|nr:hypothetical protein [Nocardioides sp.]